MKVNEIMRKRYVSFNTDDNLSFVLRIMAKNGINSAPVFDGRELAGIISTDNILKFLMPKKKFLFFWKKGEAVPIIDIEKVTASEIMNKPGVVLKKEDRLESVLGKIAGEHTCIPVIDEKKMIIGLVRKDDMLKLMLKTFARGAYHAGNGNNKYIGTDIDKLLDFINSRGTVSSKAVSKELGLSLKTVEKMGEVLKDHELIKMKYSFLGGAQMSSIKPEVPPRPQATEKVKEDAGKKKKKYASKKKKGKKGKRK